ncbi:hypothetical protein CI1B_83940 [Bradyrhizobium ivorense]|uniref:SPOR domain-containing protein n=1 Tax=Bradyrhizobium ivorense TaxID=2511166 RepID=A0A508U175_9BRAD|nr:hypothetical protein [Bradyrhizobium ivorense]VIO80353.1 hypothetical protein CI1B_83940 [Bradyrhizobium ivorense]
MSPFKSEDRTELVEQDDNEFVVMRSPASAEHDPHYEEVGRFATRAQAEKFLESTDFV